MNRCAPRWLALAALVALPPLSVEAASIQFDQVEYSVEPGNQVTTRVEFVVYADMIDVASVSAKVFINPVDSAPPGAVTTSAGLVTASNVGTYILQNPSTLNTTNTTATTVIAGDFSTTFQNETVLADTYSYIEIVWQAAPSASGDYVLTFDPPGTGSAGFTYLADTTGATNYVTTPTGTAIIHVVPEPHSAMLLSLAGLCALVAHRRRRSGVMPASTWSGVPHT